MNIPDRFLLHQEPVADEKAVIREGNYRFTVITDRLIRMEHSPTGTFEDRASLAFWFRRQPVPEFTAVRKNATLEIDTGALQITCDTSSEGFTASSLSVLVRSTGARWAYGDSWWGSGQLFGTARTLDQTNGQLELENGPISRQGWAVYDDSRSVVFNDQGWAIPRSNPGNTDITFFGYGQAYPEAVRDLCRVGGEIPLIPRYILGNWWSRFWAYSQEELKQLMEDFARHEIPLSVCIIDMDWHLDGWTGYTWRKELWPDPQGFIDWLHRQNLHTALNLHPSDGVGAHESQYKAMCEAMGQEPLENGRVKFDIANPVFADAYFRLLHHPYEKMGVDFWWMDWQQERVTSTPGLDPLFWLNHLHYLDLRRDGIKRPFIFSRWGGLGNHRYPIGFSGDTEVTWESLKFQPYFTATAANVAYGWWSHDIGGHMGGVEDDELYARWVQFGVFSPILRLHSTKNPYHERCPWKRGTQAAQAAAQALRLRHRLVPYLYSMAWRATRESIPLVLPLYHTHPREQAAYEARDQYWFGSQLLAAPFLHPATPQTCLSRVRVWLPEGAWYHLFSGHRYRGGRWVQYFGTLEDIPVFAKAGAIIPLDDGDVANGTDLPRRLEIQVFPGESGSFELVEDDGETLAYKNGAYASTLLRMSGTSREIRFEIDPAKGQPEILPANREIKVIFRSISKPDQVLCQRGQHPFSPQVEFDQVNQSCAIRFTHQPAEHIEITLRADNLTEPADWRPEEIRRFLRLMRIGTNAKFVIDVSIGDLLSGRISARDLPGLNEAQAFVFDSLAAA